jgi:hypothetical protein
VDAHLRTSSGAIENDLGAEAWLIVGAAYLQLGKVKDARRCFAGCVAEATHGDKKECAALLR